MEISVWSTFLFSYLSEGWSSLCTYWHGLMCWQNYRLVNYFCSVGKKPTHSSNPRPLETPGTYQCSSKQRVNARPQAQQHCWYRSLQEAECFGQADRSSVAYSWPDWVYISVSQPMWVVKCFSSVGWQIKWLHEHRCAQRCLRGPVDCSGRLY